MNQLNAMRYFIVGLLLSFGLNLFAQQVEANRSFLTIMVIPYAKPGDTISMIINKNELFRAVIGQVNHVFEDRGFRSKDFEAILRIPDLGSDLPRFKIKEAIKNAKVDVAIYVEVKLNEFTEGDRQLQLKLKAVDQYSAENYATNIAVESTRRRYSDFEQALTEIQLVKQLNGFADQLERKFVDILKNGRTVTVKVNSKPGSKVKLGSKVDNSDLDLSGTIDAWIKDRTLMLYSAGGDNDYWQAECKIPMFDKNQKSVTPFNFRTELKVFLEKLRFSNMSLNVVDVTVNSIIEFVIENKN